MKFSATELVTIEEALRGMNSSPLVEKLLQRVMREKPRKLISVIPNRKLTIDEQCLAKGIPTDGQVARLGVRFR